MLVPNRQGSTPAYRYGFQGQEKDDELKGEGNNISYNDRFFDPRVGRWLSLDPLQKDYPWASPYNFVSNSPIGKIDVNGQWDIEVHAFKDRAKYGYAVLIVKNRLGEEVYRTTVRVQGMKNKANDNNPRQRNKTFGDTPTGKYKILEWRKTGDGTNYSKQVYGPNDLLATQYLEGEGEGRDGMHVHGGRQEGKDFKKFGSELWNTGGCMRIKDADLLEMKKITDALENNDDQEKPNLLNVNNDLEYKDGEYKIPIDNTSVIKKNQKSVKDKKQESLETKANLEKVKDEIPTFNPDVFKAKSKSKYKGDFNKILKDILNKKKS